MTLTKTDRARVTHAAGRQPPLGLGPTSPEGGPQQNPRRRRRQGTLCLITGVANGPASRRRTPPVLLRYLIIHTTLGNGYLGSRIDEERSEMRYLV